MKPPKKAAARRDFDRLVELVGTVCKCYCGKQGFLSKVRVRSEPVHRKLKYSAEWEHPNPKDLSCSGICGYDL